VRGMTVPANSPITPSLRTIREAHALLGSYFPPSRLLAAPALSGPGAPPHLKLELELPTGSFKPRGALWALQTNLRRRAIEEVTASSTGNHGAAVAYAAEKLGLRATIFLPRNSNPVKFRKIAELSARIVEAGGVDLADAFLEAQRYSSRPGVYFLNDATDPDLPAGPATIALEIFEQWPETRAIFVPMGDTALIRGVGAAVRQIDSRVRIVGVQADRAPSYFLSWKEGRVIPTATCDTCADGLATRTPEADNVRAIRELVDDVILVSDDEMIAAIGRLHDHGVIAEPSGAAATAAFLKQPVSDSAVLLVTGGNISDAVRRRAGI